MAAPKINLPSPELQPPLAPYEHGLNSNGDCVKDCRAVVGLSEQATRLGIS